MEGCSCIKNRGVHEDRKYDEDCEGGERGICPFVKSIMGPAFATILYEIPYEIATIPTMSA